MTDRDRKRPLEESPEVAAAVDDDTGVLQLQTGGGADRHSPSFTEPGSGPGPEAGDDELIGEMVEGKLFYYPSCTREDYIHTGRVTDNLTSGKVFRDLGLEEGLLPERDRAMICGSLAFNVDVKAILEAAGLSEGANSDPGHFVVEKAFVGEGI